MRLVAFIATRFVIIALLMPFAYATAQSPAASIHSVNIPTVVAPASVNNLEYVPSFAVAVPATANQKPVINVDLPRLNNKPASAQTIMHPQLPKQQVPTMTTTIAYNTVRLY